MGRFSAYDIFKTIVYLIGLIFTIYSILKFGLINSHTPPLGFVIPFFTIFIALLWELLDWILKKIVSDKVRINKLINIWTLVINSAIVLFILSGLLWI